MTMVRFKTKMDSTGRIYIARPIRESGIVNTIEILPNSQAAVIYKAGTPVKDVIASLETIMMDLKHHLNREEAEQK